MNEREKMLARFRADRSAGLIDIKFFVANDGNLKSDDLIAAFNELEEAAEAGHVNRQRRLNETFAQNKLDEFINDWQY